MNDRNRFSQANTEALERRTSAAVMTWIKPIILALFPIACMFFIGWVWDHEKRVTILETEKSEIMRTLERIISNQLRYEAKLDRHIEQSNKGN